MAQRIRAYMLVIYNEKDANDYRFISYEEFDSINQAVSDRFDKILKNNAESYITGILPPGFRAEIKL